MNGPKTPQNPQAPDAPATAGAAPASSGAGALASTFSASTLDALAGVANRNIYHPVLNEVDHTILGLLAAKGPVGVGECVAECRMQALPFGDIPKEEQRAVVLERIATMMKSGYIQVYDDMDDAYEPTEFGQAVLCLGSYPEALRAKIAHAWNPAKAFNHLVSAPNGHHFWLEPKTGGIVVSDRSNDGSHGEIGDPSGTDDGVLYLDFNRMMEPSDGGGWTVPVIDPKGRETRTVAGQKEAELLRNLFDMREKTLKQSIKLEFPSVNLQTLQAVGEKYLPRDFRGFDPSNPGEAKRLLDLFTGHMEGRLAALSDALAKAEEKFEEDDPAMQFFRDVHRDASNDFIKLVGGR